MIQSWQLQEAKNRLSQVIEDAINVGPQLITRRGTEIAIVLSYAEYQKIIASQSKLTTFFRESPLADVELDLSRDTSAVREEFKL
ncbi:MAG: type II toxin-antitoxin system Phd/YefM family antitoxin [Caldilineaceae bacterium]|nr:type II toxin-antitoxin system Phd/YefM family antitoxin [Caldilineaceae bacterium]MCB0127227.1 type II toxin-antitoxin system Phd/YefM family antitoxin [Caldilineaceae bacterium]MCB0189557.1 type II toxin-antitoxin system Phd/YefM family antitoxin [Caldilineaceae bacterium]